MEAINIQIEVPNIGMYEIEELKHKLTAYAEKLVSDSHPKKTNKAKRYRHKALLGILSEEWQTNDLRDEYLKDKYNV